MSVATELRDLHEQAAYEPIGHRRLKLLPFCVTCRSELGWPCETSKLLTALAADRDRLRDAVQEALGAFYVSPGITTGRQAKAIAALRAALAPGTPVDVE